MQCFLPPIKQRVGQHHLSLNIGPAVAESAVPAPLPLGIVMTLFLVLAASWGESITVLCGFYKTICTLDMQE